MAPIIGSNVIIYYIFLKIKNIILYSPNVLFLIDEKDINTNAIYLDKIENSNLVALNYLFLLVSLSLRFTQSRSIEDVNYELKEEFYGVNAPSCEFLDFLVNIISDRDLLIIIAY